MAKFLLPLDDSKHSEAAFRWACKNTPKDAKFEILYGDLNLYRHDYILARV
jgi:hypothetical protein